MVRVIDLGGIHHSVEVEADSLFEAAARGIAALKRADWMETPFVAALRVEVDIAAPIVTHRLTLGQIYRWLDGTTKSPSELTRKKKLRELLAG